ncbi:ras-related protein Rab-32-like [Dendronephthya gigantea]|uniref:ras-related protein Rab-32-like n=1 Tax=Dendronephthya gigantea TaxID=151771 RepID=UPI00106A6CFB|nr:ras-related protein Rab-32-like [Dendronephthya gigantea]
MQNTAVNKKKEKIFKVLVLGDVGTGKTSFIRRYVSQKFFINYKATIGSDFAVKVIDWDENCQIKLQLWDIAGQERFTSMTRVYYRDAVAAFVAFDVTRAATFDAVEQWKSDLDSKLFLANGQPIPAVLLANKCDQEYIIKKERIDKLRDDLGFLCSFDTSAKENIGIDEAISFIVTKILENEESLSTRHANSLELPNQQLPEQNCCACHFPKSKPLLKDADG